MVVYELQHKYPLVILLNISDLKKSTYYYTLKKLLSNFKTSMANSFKILNAE